MFNRDLGENLAANRATNQILLAEEEVLPANHANRREKDWQRRLPQKETKETEGVSLTMITGGRVQPQPEGRRQGRRGRSGRDFAGGPIRAETAPGTSPRVEPLARGSDAVRHTCPPPRRSRYRVVRIAG